MRVAARLIIVSGAALALGAVVLGAFGAHALKAQLSPDLMTVYQTGVQYHLAHALGIILIGILVQISAPTKWLCAAGWTMTAGVILFSGSLYALCLTGMRTWGMITPVGGVMLLAAWLLVVIGAMKVEE